MACLCGSLLQEDGEAAEGVADSVVVLIRLLNDSDELADNVLREE